MTRARRFRARGPEAAASVLLAALIFSLESQPIFGATITHLQSAAVTAGSSSATSLSQRFPSANTAGSLIVAAVSFDSSNGTAWSCSDSRGNTYSIALLRNDIRHNQAVGICYSAATASGQNTATVSSGDVSHQGRSLAIHWTTAD